MNFSIPKMAAVCRVEESSIHDAARLFGYLRVGKLLCIQGILTKDFLDEVRLIQQAKNAMAERRRAKMNAPPSYPHPVDKCFCTEVRIAESAIRAQKQRKGGGGEKARYPGGPESQRGAAPL